MRPQTASDRRRGLQKRDKATIVQNKSILNSSSMNQSKYELTIPQNKIINVQSVSQKQYSSYEIQSECPNGSKKVQFNKLEVVTMLMKFQLEKMGFRYINYQNQIKKFLNRQNLDPIPLKNLKQWVLSKKSEIVDMILQQNSIQIVSSNNFHHQQPINYNFKRQLDLNQNLMKRQQQIAEEPSNSTLKFSTQIIKVSKKHKQQQIENIICPICLDETKKYMTFRCGHIFCKYCIKNYILQNNNSGNFLIQCPQANCPEKISQKQASRVLDRNDLNRFIKFKEKVQMQNNPFNKFCNKPDCGSLLTQNQNRKLFCKSCKLTFCEMCQEPQHPGKDCSEALLKQMDETYRSFKIKKCPSCTAPIQKIDGCNHMTCKKCKNQFCWICLEKYTPYHYRIYNCCGCPGLQFQDVQQMGYKRFLQVLFFVFLPVFFALSMCAVFLVLPLYIVFNLFTRPCKWITQSQEKCELICLKNICCFLPECLVVMIAYFVFFPRSIIYALIIAPIKYFGSVGELICNVI